MQIKFVKMPGASWKNAIKRKTHKERAQPADRAKKYGLLEKKKDYVLRARDFHKKEDKIMHLRRKAALRNPDEFYFGMQKAKTKGGVHGLAAEGAEALPVDVARLLKTQDAAYLTMKRVADEKKADRLAASLHGLLETAPNRHTVFLESGRAAEGFDPAAHFGTAPELAGRAFNRPRVATLASQAVAGAARVGDVKRALKKRDRAYQEAAERQGRARKLRRTAAHVEAQRQRMGKGRKFKVKDAENGNPAVFKWKKQRQK